MPYPDRFYPVVDSVAWVARLTKLKRKPVPEIAMLERWGGTPLVG